MTKNKKLILIPLLLLVGIVLVSGCVGGGNKECTDWEIKTTEKNQTFSCKGTINDTLKCDIVLGDLYGKDCWINGAEIVCEEEATIKDDVICSIYEINNSIMAVCEYNLTTTRFTNISEDD